MFGNAASYPYRCCQGVAQRVSESFGHEGAEFDCDCGTRRHTFVYVDDHRRAVGIDLSDEGVRHFDHAHRAVCTQVLNSLTDLLDEATYWIEQYWTYALYAAVAIVRGCADSANTPLDSVLADLTSKHAIDIA